MDSRAVSSRAALDIVTAMNWGPGVTGRYDAEAMVWTMKCIRGDCPGVMTKDLATDRYGPCNMCGATR